jgi:hypothetical protein
VVLAATEGSNGVPDWMVLAVPVVCAAAVVYLAYAIHRYGGRERAVQRVAASHGLTYSSTDPAGIGALRFPTFARARGVRVTNVVWDARGSGSPRARAFDFSLYEDRPSARGGRDTLDALADEVFDFDSRPGGGAEVRRTYSAPRSGAVVRVDAFLPPCTITPTSWASRAFETMGLPDLDFESDEFNRGWDVRCGDRRFASLFIDAQLIDLVLGSDQKIAIETFGNYVLFTAAFAKPTRMPRLLEAASRLPAILSPLVVEEYPTVTAMEARHSMDAWANRPDGRGGVY